MKAAKADSAVGVSDAAPAAVQQQEPQHGGSYVRDPNAGTIIRTAPVPAAAQQPVQE
jgi:hypothetical protein